MVFEEPVSENVHPNHAAFQDRFRQNVLRSLFRFYGTEISSVPSLPHVGMHVCHEQVHQTVVVVIERLRAHSTPDRLRKDLLAAAFKPFSLDVFVVVVVTLHIDHVQIDPSVPIKIERCRVA